MRKPMQIRLTRAMRPVHSGYRIDPGRGGFSRW